MYILYTGLWTVQACNSGSVMNFSLIFISIVLAFTSTLVNGLSCIPRTELECVTETKCELAYSFEGIPYDRCVPEQVCDCVLRSFRGEYSHIP